MLTRAGLGNRLRAIESAISLCRDINSRLTIIWPENEALGAPFNALFEAVDGLEIVRTPPLLRLYLHWKAMGWHRLTTIIKPWLPFDSMYFDDEILSLSSNETELADSFAGKCIFVLTDHQFYQAKTRFSWVNPNKEIEQLVKRFSHNWPGKMVGVHIRRTDHVHAIRHATDEKFLEAMQSVLAKDHNTHFFLATDDPATAERFSSIFGDKLSYRKSLPSRDSAPGMTDAVIDWFLLSLCSLVLSSSLSSFSETAAWRGNVPIDYIG